MNSIVNTINKLEPLQPEDFEVITNLLKQANKKMLKKGDYIFTKGDTPPISVYVKSGLLRHFVADNNRNEKIIQFFMEWPFLMIATAM